MDELIGGAQLGGGIFEHPEQVFEQNNLARNDKTLVVGIGGRLVD